MQHRLTKMTFRPQRPASPATEPATFDALARLSAAILEAQSILGTNAPARLSMSLVEVAMKPGITRVELARALDIPINTAMRDLKTLSTERRNGSPGLGLVSERWDTIAGRHLTYTLTARGVEAVDRIAAATLGKG